MLVLNCVKLLKVYIIHLNCILNSRERWKLALTLGTQIRSFRELRNMTIKQLADQTGLSSALISQVERDLANPSISSLKEIANALEVPLGAFFENYTQATSPVVRKNERKKLIPNDKITYELLSRDMSGKMELIYNIFEEGASTGDEMYAHAGEEGGLVIQGTMEVTIGTDVYTLNEGDSIYFKADIPHRYRNIGKGKLIAIWAITPPSF